MRTLRIGEVNDLGGNELIQEIRLPIPSGRTGSAYEKFLSRGVWEYACVNVGAVRPARTTPERRGGSRSPSDR